MDSHKFMTSFSHVDVKSINVSIGTDTDKSDVKTATVTVPTVVFVSNCTNILDYPQLKHISLFLICIRTCPLPNGLGSLLEGVPVLCIDTLVGAFSSFVRHVWNT